MAKGGVNGILFILRNKPTKIYESNFELGSVRRDTD